MPPSPGIRNQGRGQRHPSIHPSIHPPTVSVSAAIIEPDRLTIAASVSGPVRSACWSAPFSVSIAVSLEDGAGVSHRWIQPCKMSLGGDCHHHHLLGGHPTWRGRGLLGPKEKSMNLSLCVSSQRFCCRLTIEIIGGGENLFSSLINKRYSK